MPASDEHLTRRLPMNDEYLAQRLTPFPLLTKDSGLLRTVGDARTYMLTLPKARKLRTHWRQVHLALFMDGKLDVAPHHTTVLGDGDGIPRHDRRRLRESRFSSTYAG
jgi:hypothetical protein